MSSTATLADENWTQSWKRAWEGFWFTPSDPSPLAVIRIAVGIATLAYLASFTGDLARWFGPQGLLPVGGLDGLGLDDLQLDARRLAVFAPPFIVGEFHVVELCLVTQHGFDLLRRLPARVQWPCGGSLVPKA